MEKKIPLGAGLFLFVLGLIAGWYLYQKVYPQAPPPRPPGKASIDPPDPLDFRVENGRLLAARVAPAGFRVVVRYDSHLYPLVGGDREEGVLLSDDQSWPIPEDVRDVEVMYFDPYRKYYTDWVRVE